MIAERLKFLRKKAGVTQVELAKKLNVATSTLAMWETERREPDFSTAGEIADFFGVTVDYLLGRDEKKEPAPVSEGEPNPELWKLIEQIPESRMPEVERYLRFQAEQKEKD